jgi:ABC-type branched-subunit amino acid transport system ATPase component
LQAHAFQRPSPPCHAQPHSGDRPAARQKGFTIVLVEQNFRFAAPLADRHYVVERGMVVKVVEKHELASNAEMLNEYLGV